MPCRSLLPEKQHGAVTRVLDDDAQADMAATCVLVLGHEAHSRTYGPRIRRRVRGMRVGWDPEYRGKAAYMDGARSVGVIADLAFVPAFLDQLLAHRKWDPDPAGTGVLTAQMVVWRIAGN